MGLSGVRANVPTYTDDISIADGSDLKAYEVFIQLERGKSHVHCGSVDAPDDQLALLFAREHYGRDQQCVQVWVVPRAAIIRTDYDKDLVFRLSDQNYRFAKGYNVGAKWRALRKARDVEEYEKEDLKEFY